MVYHSWSNWNLEVMVFEERGNKNSREKTSRRKGENQQRNSFHIVHGFLSLRVRAFRYVHTPSHHTEMFRYHSWLLSPNQ